MKKVFVASLAVILLIILIIGSYGTMKQVSWEENDTFALSYEIKSVEETRNNISVLDAPIASDMTIDMKGELYIKIVKIIEENKTVNLEEYGPNTVAGKPTKTNQSYNSTVLSNSYEEGYISANFVWDPDRESVLLNGVNINLFQKILVEPNWKSINNGLKNGLNKSIKLDTVHDGEKWIDLTLGDLIDNHCRTFKIMKENTLDAAKERFTEKTTKWTYEFDFAGYMVEGFWSAEELKWVYIRSDRSLLSLSLEYDEGGKFKEFKANFQLLFDFDNKTIESESKVDYKVKKGGMLEVIGLPLDWSYTFLAVIVLGVVTLNIRKMKTI